MMLMALIWELASSQKKREVTPPISRQDVRGEFGWAKNAGAGHSPRAAAYALVRFLALTRFGKPGLFHSMSARTMPLSR